MHVCTASAAGCHVGGMPELCNIEGFRGGLCPRQQDVDAINLVNQHGSEGLLADRFLEQADRFSKARSGFRLIPFDFHKICGATSYQKCSPSPCSRPVL